MASRSVGDIQSAFYADLDAKTVENIQKARGLDHKDLLGTPVKDFRLPYRNIGDLLRRQAKAHPTREYLTFYQNEDPEKVEVSRLMYSQVLERVLRVARVMKGLGLKEGDTVATVDLFNHADTVIILFAAWGNGYRVAPINMEEDRERVKFILENSKAKAAFVRAAHAKEFKELAKGLGVEHLIQLGGNLERGFTDLEALVAREGNDYKFPEVALTEEALLVYTSGTTGLPKGCVLTHEMLFDVDAVVEFHKFTEQDVFMTSMRLFHVNAIVTSALAALMTGARLVLMRKWQPRAFWDVANRERATTTSVVPAMLADLLRLRASAKDEDVEAVRGRLRALICGAGTLKKVVAQEWLDGFRIRITHGWGMSETTCWGCWLPHDLDDKEYRVLVLDREAPSIGTPNRHCVMGIYDKQGRMVEPGQKGEIVLAGPIVLARYFQRPDANQGAFRFGVLQTGDEGFYLFDAKQRPMFFITGRLKEIIERGGEKFSPYLMDDDLSRMKGVRNALVYGFPHNRLGQEVGVVLEVEEGGKVGLEDVQRHCKGLGYPWAKAPKELRVVAKLPKTATGKDTRKAFADLFKGTEEKHYPKPAWWKE